MLDDGKDPAQRLSMDGRSDILSIAFRNLAWASTPKSHSNKHASGAKDCVSWLPKGLIPQAQGRRRERGPTRSKHCAGVAPKVDRDLDTVLCEANDASHRGEPFPMNQRFRQTVILPNLGKVRIVYDGLALV
jgi:hypothetical protein